MDDFRRFPIEQSEHFGDYTVHRYSRETVRRRMQDPDLQDTRDCFITNKEGSVVASVDGFGSACKLAREYAGDK